MCVGHPSAALEALALDLFPSSRGLGDHSVHVCEDLHTKRKVSCQCVLSVARLISAPLGDPVQASLALAGELAA